MLLLLMHLMHTSIVDLCLLILKSALNLLIGASPLDFHLRQALSLFAREHLINAFLFLPHSAFC